MDFTARWYHVAEISCKRWMQVTRLRGRKTFATSHSILNNEQHRTLATQLSPWCEIFSNVSLFFFFFIVSFIKRFNNATIVCPATAYVTLRNNDLKWKLSSPYLAFIPVYAPLTIGRPRTYVWLAWCGNCLLDVGLCLPRNYCSSVIEFSQTVTGA